MREGRYILLTTALLSLLMIASCSGEKRQAKIRASRADSLMYAMGEAHGYERVLALADSLEQAGDLSEVSANRWRGVAYFYQGMNRTSEFYYKKAVGAVKKCVAEFCQSGMDEECFHRAKQQVKGSLSLGAESSLSLMRTIGKYALFLNKPFDVDLRLAALAQLDRADVNAMIPQLFDTKAIGVGYVGKQTDFDLTEIYK